MIKEQSNIFTNTLEENASEVLSSGCHDLVSLFYYSRIHNLNYVDHHCNLYLSKWSFINLNITQLCSLKKFLFTGDFLIKKTMKLRLKGVHRCTCMPPQVRREPNLTATYKKNPQKNSVVQQKDWKHADRSSRGSNHLLFLSVVGLCYLLSYSHLKSQHIKSYFINTPKWVRMKHACFYTISMEFNFTNY